MWNAIVIVCVVALFVWGIVELYKYTMRRREKKALKKLSYIDNFDEKSTITRYEVNKHGDASFVGTKMEFLGINEKNGVKTIAVRLLDHADRANKPVIEDLLFDTWAYGWCTYESYERKSKNHG